MAAKHPSFTPWFRRIARDARRSRPRSPLWPILVDRLPRHASGVRAHAERRANAWYFGRLADRFLHVYDTVGEIDELKAYLGPRFDQHKLEQHVAVLERELQGTPDECTFYRTSEAYLYDLTVFALSGTKLPYRRQLHRFVTSGARVLDYGCGIGSDGLAMLADGYDVSFADFDNPCTRYLRWRLERRGIVAPVYNVDEAVPEGFDAVYCFDVIEHVDDPFGLLDRLESLGALVCVNFLAPTADDTPLHKPLNIERLLDHTQRRGIRHYRRYWGRSHLVIYDGRCSAATDRVNRVRSTAALRVGEVVTRLHELDARVGQWVAR